MILFVDDEHERRKEFIKNHSKDEIIFAETSSNAIKLMQEHDFDEMHLDHDLGSVHDERNKAYDGSYPMMIHSIRPFVEYLCKYHNVYDCALMKVTVHSWNEAAGYNMERDLRDNGYDAKYQRFEFSAI